MVERAPWVPTGRSAHRDTFARDHLPPHELWPVMDFSTLPELAAYPGQLNAAVELVDRNVAAGRGARTALIFGDARWTYSALQDRVDRIARTLVEDFGLVTGNRVLLRGPNNPMMAAAWLAVVKAGGVAVATMPLLRARELAHVVDAAQVTLALSDVTFADELAAAERQTASLAAVSLFTALGDGSDAAADLDARLAANDGGFAAADTAADDVALIAFTSGTTGQPKGTVHFHRDVLAMCDCFPKSTFGARTDDIYTGSPPLAFTFGLGALLCFPLRSGAAAVLVAQPAPDVLLETIARERATALYTAPTMYRAMTDLVGQYDLSSLEKCVSAGEHLPLPTFAAWREATGIPIIDGIGATEMIHIFVSAAGDDIRAGATGRAIPGYTAALVDDDGNELPPGATGNLAVRGPTGCRYLDNPERQRAYVRGGWNLPGDIYRTDEDGTVAH